MKLAVTHPSLKMLTAVLLVALLSPGLASGSIEQPARDVISDSVTQAAPSDFKVLMITFNPTIESQGGVRLTQLMGWLELRCGTSLLPDSPRSKRRPAHQPRRYHHRDGALGLRRGQQLLCSHISANPNT